MCKTRRFFLSFISYLKRLELHHCYQHHFSVFQTRFESVTNFGMQISLPVKRAKYNFPLVLYVNARVLTVSKATPPPPPTDL
jgi:hypothetical protein